jgi:hypothetical protein
MGIVNRYFITPLLTVQVDPIRRRSSGPVSTSSASNSPEHYIFDSLQIYYQINFNHKLIHCLNLHMHVTWFVRNRCDRYSVKVCQNEATHHDRIILTTIVYTYFSTRLTDPLIAYHLVGYYGCTVARVSYENNELFWWWKPEYGELDGTESVCVIQYGPRTTHHLLLWVVSTFAFPSLLQTQRRYSYQ